MYCIIDKSLEKFTYIYRARSEFNVLLPSIHLAQNECYVWMTVQNTLYVYIANNWKNFKLTTTIRERE